MSNGEIQVNYGELEKITHRLIALGEGLHEKRLRLHQTLIELENGGMKGRAAESFFDEMHHEVIASLKRLEDLFPKIAHALREVMGVMRTGEENAGNLFKGDGLTGSIGAAAFPNIKAGSDFGDYSDAYDNISDALEKKGGLPAQVRFFDAAGNVTDWKNLGGLEVLNMFGGISDDGLGYLKGLSNHLYENVNRPHANRLMAGDGSVLPSPAGDGQTFNNAFDHDLRMVEVEQGHVQTYIERGIQTGQLQPSEVSRLSDVLNNDPFTDRDEWVERALGRPMNFNNLGDREALGKALIFQKHGKTEADFLAYMRQARQ